MAENTTLVHVTHEAADKIGGIGAVLQGFFTSKYYQEVIDRSILVGPLFSTDGLPSERLGKDGKVLYSSMDGIEDTGYAPAFRMIESFFNTGIVYGHRTFIDDETGAKNSVEILLFDVRYMIDGPINEFKKHLYHEFGIRSDLYENIWEYEQYVRLAPVTIAALKEIGAAHDSTTIISHEFMGMATALAGILEPSCEFKTAFYAHEVATIRKIVEEHPGHDTMFYNVLKKAQQDGVYIDDVFGDQNSYFKHAFVEASKHCDCICAVGDYVVKELEFLSPEFKTSNIHTVYNGIPAYKISISDKLKAKEKLQQYCDNLLGYKPDYVFTHVTRLVDSKGLWRDLGVLEYLEKEFRIQGKTGVMFLLSTEVAQRRGEDILNMESEYNWPVAHREGMPDLSGGETKFYTKIQEFNARNRNIKIVFLNQFGFEPQYCGKRMPRDMEFMDIRKGSDVEFGMSIYEPFGIAQLEPLTFGGICVVSNVCGCAGFVRDVTGGENVKNVIIADYTNLKHNGYSDMHNPLDIDLSVRNGIEESVNEKIAMQICSRLAKSESEIDEMLQSGFDLAKNMSWDVIVRDYLLNKLSATKNKTYSESIN